MKMKYQVNEKGYYGNFGGSYIPEMLFPNVEELRENYLEIIFSKNFHKREDLLHTGAHKINNTLGQILIAKHLGKTRVIAETGAGQHGVATATVCALMGLECIVYMG